VRQYLADRTKAGYQRRLVNKTVANNASTVASNNSLNVPVRRARNVANARKARLVEKAIVQPYQRTYNLSGFDE
jgi:hypothetical protein